MLGRHAKAWDTVMYQALTANQWRWRIQGLLKASRPLGRISAALLAAVEGESMRSSPLE